MSKFSERLKELREEKGLSYQKLGEILGVSGVSLGYYERGERVPDIHTLQNICGFFNVTSDYMIGLSDYRTTETAALGDALGLSERAVCFLRFLKNCGDKSYSGLLNWLIETSAIYQEDYDRINNDFPSEIMRAISREELMPRGDVQETPGLLGEILEYFTDGPFINEETRSLFVLNDNDTPDFTLNLQQITAKLSESEKDMILALYDHAASVEFGKKIVTAKRDYKKYCLKKSIFDVFNTSLPGEASNADNL